MEIAGKTEFHRGAPHGVADELFSATTKVCGEPLLMEALEDGEVEGPLYISRWYLYPPACTYDYVEYSGKRWFNLVVLSGVRNEFRCAWFYNSTPFLQDIFLFMQIMIRLMVSNCNLKNLSPDLGFKATENASNTRRISD